MQKKIKSGVSTKSWVWDFKWVEIEVIISWGISPDKELKFAMV